MRVSPPRFAVPPSWRGPGRQMSAHRPGRNHAAPWGAWRARFPLSRAATQSGQSSSPAGCYEHTDVRVPRLGPARGEADNDDGHRRPLPSIGSPRARLSLMARSVRAPQRGRRYDCSLSSAQHSALIRVAPCRRSPDTSIRPAGRVGTRPACLAHHPELPPRSSVHSRSLGFPPRGCPRRAWRHVLSSPPSRVGVR